MMNKRPKRMAKSHISCVIVLASLTTSVAVNGGSAAFTSTNISSLMRKICNTKSTSSQLYSFNSKRQNDASRMTIEQLQRAAQSAGYDVLGMDRDALEMVVRGFDGFGAYSQETNMKDYGSQAPPYGQSSSNYGDNMRSYTPSSSSVQFPNSVANGNVDPFRKYRQNANPNENMENRSVPNPNNGNTIFVNPTSGNKVFVNPNSGNRVAVNANNNRGVVNPNIRDRGGDIIRQEPKETINSSYSSSNYQSAMTSTNFNGAVSSARRVTSPPTNRQQTQFNPPNPPVNASIDQKRDEGLSPQAEKKLVEDEIIDELQTQARSQRRKDIRAISNRAGKKYWFSEDTKKAGLIGFCTGPFAVSPITYLHTFKFPGDELIVNVVSQYQFGLLADGFSAAAFAILYRYFIQDDKDDYLVSAIGSLQALNT